MELQEVEVIIGADGQVRLHVRGVKGESCLDLTAPLEKALGEVIRERHLTYEAEEPELVLEEQRKRRVRDGG